MSPKNCRLQENVRLVWISMYGSACLQQLSHITVLFLQAVKIYENSSPEDYGVEKAIRKVSVQLFFSRPGHDCISLLAGSSATRQTTRREVYAYSAICCTNERPLPSLR